MSIKVQRILNGGNTVEIWDEEGGHGGIVQMDDITYPPARLDGTGENEDALIIRCPRCPNITMHTIGVGEGQGNVHQLLFIHKLKRKKGGSKKQKLRAAKKEIKEKIEKVGRKVRFNHEKDDDDDDGGVQDVEIVGGRLEEFSRDRDAGKIRIDPEITGIMPLDPDLGFEDRLASRELRPMYSRPTTEQRNQLKALWKNGS